jgi:hypothetical protein
VIGVECWYSDCSEVTGSEFKIVFMTGYRRQKVCVEKMKHFKLTVS